jgi:predicted esterase
VHGIYDIVVPIQVAESFDTKLQAAGIETHFIKIEGDHAILTNEVYNLQTRYNLEPFVKRIFGLN